LNFSRAIRTSSGGELTITLDEEDTHISIAGTPGTLSEEKTQPFTIEFDWLMENKHKREFFEAFAVDTMFTQYMLRVESRLPDLQNSPVHFFTSEDYDFAQVLKSKGLPSDIALRISYLTSYSMEEPLIEERTAIVEHFFKQGHTVRLQNTGWSAGMTTLEPYILIALNSNCALADQLARQAAHFPDKLFATLAAFSGLLRSKFISASITDEQLNALTSMITPTFPSNRNVDSSNFVIAALVQLVESVSNWNQASSDFNNPQEAQKRVAEHLRNKFFDNYSSPPEKSIKTMASLIVSVYGEEAALGSVNLLDAHRLLVRADNPHYLSGLIAVADHLASGGARDAPLDWIIALDPSIEQKEFFSRTLIETEI